MKKGISIQKKLKKRLCLKTYKRYMQTVQNSNELLFVWHDPMEK